MSDYQSRLLNVIPGGAHTYSRGFDQFPANAPQILTSGKGAYVFDPDNKRYLDYGMALRSVILGYADEAVSMAAIEQIWAGNNLTRASIVELEAAELLVDMIDAVDMVKFTKNGSTAVSAAVKLARAYTGRDLIARCGQHPFFSYDDWFIGSTPLTRGIPQNVVEQTKCFNYNDLASLEQLFALYPQQIACVVMEPATTEHPAPSATHEGETFLHDVQRLCASHGAVFILDEMITGFRWDLRGAQHKYRIKPDLCTFGKAMANGFSVAAVAGRREIMELGSIEKSGAERLFLLSTTHGAEMCGLGAFVKTAAMLRERDVVNHIWSYGAKLKSGMNALAAEAGVADYFRVEGIDCSPGYLTLDSGGNSSMALRTLFNQEMIRQGVLMPWIALCREHGEAELEQTLSAVKNALRVYAQALESGWENFLEGPIIKPVFRKYN
ncbi:glutamate-1-semialdehyde 2,1-aminomutase [Hahella aquimaris]|uniref:glutamate-1-semialdehyde 2,1-aminomutase n=1 Tax=Hahella sp. HNIBRBA332 TaxID=3015983 RepID=UPI00273B97ED|nr:glutamate-1-semialdehyde 2,1-aminomutase [Hahella sp. HNIBRBA332]WLQ15011.1 glutamate-1-semialdehyde 2,1-aminomutase [Hahella sp. HNIBRBA332]